MTNDQCGRGDSGVRLGVCHLSHFGLENLVNGAERVTGCGEAGRVAAGPAPPTQRAE